MKSASLPAGGASPPASFRSSCSPAAATTRRPRAARPHDPVEPRRPGQRRRGAGRGEAAGRCRPPSASRSIATAPTSRRRSRRAADGRIVGLVTGLANGANTITATYPTSSSPAPRLVITNHPIGGPVLLGVADRRRGSARRRCRSPQSATRRRSNASGLTTTATDAQCNIATEFKLFYRTTTPVTVCSATRLPVDCPSRRRRSPSDRRRRRTLLQAVRRRAATPADSVAMTTTTAGLTVPYIVRVERGTINRGIYDIAVLFDPTEPLDGAGAAAAVERQGRLQLRRLDRPAAPAVPHRAELGRRHGAVARLHGRRQQPDRLALQLEPRPRRRDDDDDEGAHRRQLRRDRVHDGQRLLGRLDPAEHGRVDLSRACSTASSRAATTPTRSRPASRSPTACCSSTSTPRPSGRR